MTLDFGQVNWLPAIVGGIAYFAIGAVWFTPMAFGKAWQRSIGWDPAATPPQMTPITYVVPLAVYVVAAVATALLAGATGSDTFGEGIVLGLVVGIGFAVPLTVTEAVFDPNKPAPWTWWIITAAYHVVGLLLVAVLVSVWA